MNSYSKRRRYRRSRDLALTACFILVLWLIAAVLQHEDKPLIFRGAFYVIDGDTLAKGSERLRLSDIDAPELDQTCHDVHGRVWQCGIIARQRLADEVASSDVECRGSGTDRYHRILVTCYNGDRDLNGQLVEQGMAVAMSPLTYRREQMRAETNKLGMWSGHFEHPASWRQEKKLEREQSTFYNFFESAKEMLFHLWQ